MVNQEVACHARHPGREPAVDRFVARQRAVHPEENFLRQVLGLMRLAGEPVTQVVHAARMPVYEFLPGRTFAPETLLYQLSVGLQLRISLGSRVASQPHP